MKKLFIILAVTALAGCSGMMGQRSSSGGMSSMGAGGSGDYFSSPYGPDGYDMQSGRPLPAGF